MMKLQILRWEIILAYSRGPARQPSCPYKREAEGDDANGWPRDQEGARARGTPRAPEAERGQESLLGSLEGAPAITVIWVHDNRYRTSGLQDREAVIPAFRSRPRALLQDVGTGRNEQERPPHTQKRTRMEGDRFGGRLGNIGAGRWGQGRMLLQAEPRWAGSPKTWEAKVGGRALGWRGLTKPKVAPFPPPLRPSLTRSAVSPWNSTSSPVLRPLTPDP